MNAIELDKKIKDGYNVKVFDIRNKFKYDSCHIENAIFIERGLLLENPEKYLSKDVKNYITCNSGNSAGYIASILIDQGFDIESIENGMNPFVKQFVKQ